MLLSDEIYEAITYDGCRHLSPSALSADMRERTILLNSLSKTYAMTGWRVGYCAAPAPIIQSMFLSLQQSSRGPATFVQDAAAVALTGPQDAVADMRASTRRRSQVLQALAGIRQCTCCRRKAASSRWWTRARPASHPSTFGDGCCTMPA